MEQMKRCQCNKQAITKINKRLTNLTGHFFSFIILQEYMFKFTIASRINLVESFEA